MIRRIFPTVLSAQKSSFRNAGMIWIILIFSAVSIVFWLGVKFNPHNASKNAAQIPLIISDKKPFKIRAKDPGGFQIPHQDKEIYNHLVKDISSHKTITEDILPPSEEPIFLREETSSASEESKKTDTITLESLHSTPAHLPSPLAPAEEEQNTSWTNVFEDLMENGIQENSQPNSSPLIYRVQLAILKSKDQAQAEWHRLRIKYKPLLQNLSMLVLSEVKSDGSLRYYIQVGAFSSPKEAETLCHTLKQNNVACLVTAEKGD